MAAKGLRQARWNRDLSKNKKNSGRYWRLVRCLSETLEPRRLLAAVSWTGGGGDGLWTDPANWSTNPSLPGPADDVTINVAGSPTITLASGTQSIHSLTSSDPISLTGGTLASATTVQLSANLTISGGTIQGGTVTATGGSALSVTSAGGTLSGVTLEAALVVPNGATLRVVGGLMLNNADVTLTSSGSNAQLLFQGTQTLGGTGWILLGGGLSTIVVQGGNTQPTAAVLTLGANITLAGSGFVSGAYSYDSVINQGTINANLSGQAITVGDNVTWTNTGTLECSNGGVLGFAGTLNNSGQTLTLIGSNGPVDINGGGEIRGGIVGTSGGVLLNANNVILDAVALSTNLNVNNGASLYVKDGLTLSNANINLTSTGTASSFIFKAPSR